VQATMNYGDTLFITKHFGSRASICMFCYCRCEIITTTRK